MESNISEFINILRPFHNEVFSGKSALSLSTNYLQKLNQFVDNFDNTSQSFHIAENNILKTNRLIENQFVINLFEKTVKLKIYPDVVNELSVRISRFTNVKNLEISKINVDQLVGLRKLRSQLQELTCCSNLEYFGDILMKCGGDNSPPHNWNELKKVKFSHNNVMEMDNSFDWTLSLHTLDISHNEFSNLDFLNQLPNLKYLNISYNKLLRVPHFKGPICDRLQILVLNNNFIEDLTGLSSLINIVQLNLNQNSLIEHNILLPISQLASLQYLSVLNNPFNFHPNHRSLTCSYLNKNASLSSFLLNGMPLSKFEKGFVGSYHPVQAQLTNTIQNEEKNILTNFVQARPKKIRIVKIEDKNENNNKAEISKLTPSPSNEHLRLKKQVEQLREEYGESWLNRHSGSTIPDVLGFEKLLLSSTPVNISGSSISANNQVQGKSDVTTFESADDTSMTGNQSSDKEDQFSTANELHVTNSTHNESKDLSDSSDGEDVFTSGEECIYLVINKIDNSQVFVVVTEMFISERDVTTSKEKARWHVNTIMKCEKQDHTSVKLEFNTLRRDRKYRLYEIDQSEVEIFYMAVRDKIDVKKLNETKKKYQCMKCSQIFGKARKNTLTSTFSVECPSCDSNLVIEL